MGGPIVSKTKKNARHLFILEISYILLKTIVVTESNSCGIARLDVIYKHEISVMDALKFQDRQEFRTCSDGDIRSTLCSPPNSRHCLQMLDQIVTSTIASLFPGYVAHLFYSGVSAL